VTGQALVATRGLPASGKSTWAVAWIAAGALRTRSNRDDLRATMFGGWTGRAEHEEAVTVAQYAAVRALLAAGWSVVVDDTNLRPEVLDALRGLAVAAGARFEVHDLTGVPVDVCIARDADRGERGERHVGHEVIRGMYDRYLAGVTQ
jgi:predicted kinase